MRFWRRSKRITEVYLHHQTAVFRKDCYGQHGAFLGKASDGKQVFDRLNIAGSTHYQSHINKHDLIFIDFSRLPERHASYDSYISRITEGLKNDLLHEFSSLALDSRQPLWDMMDEIFQRTNQRFVFVMDEWDAVFHMPFISQKEQYLLFLKNLLKNQVYVELAYMTGILPIAKYSGGSELNMFSEYNMATQEKFSGYFGFS